jgi:hypothetical protein
MVPGRTRIGNDEAEQFARAAIEAMREPTGRALLAGVMTLMNADRNSLPECTPDNVLDDVKSECEFLKAAINAMIDEALK